MKNIVIALSLALGLIILSPSLSEAHMGATAGTVSTEEFEEMQDVMIKMMNGEQLSATESEEMIAFMQSHSSEYWPMMGMMGAFGSDNWGNMMWGGTFSALSWIMVLTTLMWLLAGILLAIFLIKKISAK